MTNRFGVLRRGLAGLFLDEAGGRRMVLMARAGFALLTAVILYKALAPSGSALEVPFWDKALHGFAFYVLMLVGAVAFADSPIWKVGLGLAVLGLLIEVLQAAPGVGRDADALDFAADVFGLALAGVALTAIRLREAIQRPG